MIYSKVATRRTIRRYKKSKVSRNVLTRCVDAARVSPSGMNRQPLKYVIVDDEKLLAEVFSTTRWAGYLPDYKPTKDEMPRAYIIVLLDKEIRENCGHDAGIAVMAITMVACEEGLGSCILGAIDREKLRMLLSIPERLDIVLAVALGYPAEKPVMDRVRSGDIKYWLDKKGVLHVPKRELKDIVKLNGWQTPLLDDSS